MNQESLFHAIGEVGDDLVARAAYPKKQNVTWLGWAALAACMALAISLANISGMLDFGAKSAAPEAQFVSTDSVAEAPTESAPVLEEAVEEEAVADTTAADVEEPASAQPVQIVFGGIRFALVENNENLLPKELVGFVEEGHPDYIGCEVYTCDSDEHIFVLKNDIFHLFEAEN